MTDVDTEFEAFADLTEVTEIDLGADLPLEAVERPSFEDVYARLFAPMRRLAYVMVDTDEQAAEVVQEAFARLYPRFDKVRDADAYVRATVLNLSRRALRRRGLSRTKLQPEPEAAASPFDHVFDAVRRLPPSQRSVVVLRYYLQLTDPEIASTLGMRVGTVKSTLHRARQSLREVLQP